MFSRMAPALAVGFLMLAPVAHGDPFPLITGSQMTYQVEGNFPLSHYTVTVIGETVLEKESLVVTQTTGDIFNNRTMYWSKSADGDTYFHGNGSTSLSPPVLFLDVPLAVGKVWSTTSTPSGSDPHEYSFEVAAYETVSVPAGTFQCYTIYEFVNGGFPSTVSSFAEGVGMVQRACVDCPSTTERLVSSSGPVAIESATWTQVRKLFE